MKPIHYLAANVLLTHMTMAAGRVIISLYAVHLQASAFLVGVLISLFTVIPMLTSVATGRLVDRIGTRLPFGVCASLIVVGAILPALWPGTVVTLFAMALLVGGGYFTATLMHSNLGGFYGKPEERAVNFSQISLGYSAANGVGPLLAGFAVDLAGFRTAFLLMALPSALGLAIFLAGKLPQRGPMPAAAKKSSVGRGVLALLRHPDLRPIYVIAVFSMMLFDVFTVLTPIYGTEIHLSASEIGIIMSTFAAASFGVRILILPLSRRFTPMQLLLIALSVGAAGMVAFGLTTTMLVLLVGAIFMGMGQGLGGPMITTALYDGSPPERVSEVMGLRISIGTACQTILPLIAGGIAAAVGTAPLFWLTAAVLLSAVGMQRAQWHRHAKPVKAA